MSAMQGREGAKPAGFDRARNQTLFGLPKWSFANEANDGNCDAKKAGNDHKSVMMPCFVEVSLVASYHHDRTRSKLAQREFRLLLNQQDQR